MRQGGGESERETSRYRWASFFKHSTAWARGTLDGEVRGGLKIQNGAGVCKICGPCLTLK